MARKMVDGHILATDEILDPADTRPLNGAHRAMAQAVRSVDRVGIMDVRVRFLQMCI